MSKCTRNSYTTQNVNNSELMQKNYFIEITVFISFQTNFE